MEPGNGDSIVLEEEIDQNYVPSEEEVREYAKWLGMELADDLDLFWIAKEGLKAPLPENWKPCKTVDTDEIYYFNFATGESTWDHPCDEYYRKLYEEEKKKKLTKDKAKHDKSKQQAKKDVSQLLGKDKKKKSRPAGKRAAHQPSPERVQAVPSPSSSIFDRKPLPGIGRQPLQGGDAVGRQTSGAPSTKADNAVVLAERSPSRTQPSSLVGHRLSQHLSVSVGSEEADEKSAEEQTPGGDSVKPSPGIAPLRTRRDGSPLHGSAAAVAGVNSEHEAMLRELRKKHARELDALEQAHMDAKDQLEGDHRRTLASKKRQWAASAEAQCDKAREALNLELDETRARHSSEIDKLESSLLDSKARLRKAAAETEKAAESARAEKLALEATLAALNRQVIEEERLLQETREATRKVHAAGASQPDGDLKRELTRVISQLEDEQKHVAELEGQLKEAKNAPEAPHTNGASKFSPEDEEKVSKIALLEARLAHSVRENDNLRKEAARVAAEIGEPCDAHSASKLEGMEVTSLKNALEETERRLSELQHAKELSTQDAKNAAAAMAEVQEKADGLESENRRLVEQIAKSNVHGEKPADNSEELRASLEVARKDAASRAGEAKQSKELEEQLRGELHASRLALRESESKIAELKGVLATAEHEKALSITAVKELTLESARLKRNMEVVRSAPDGDNMRELADTLVSELKELRAQLAAVVLEKDSLNEEIGTLKQQLVSSEGVHRAERGMLDSSLASKQRQVESLSTTTKRLEAELLAGQRREEELHATEKTLRENVAASKLEAWRLQEKLKENATEAKRMAAGLVSAQQEAERQSNQKDDSGANMVSSADFERARAETRETASRLQLAEEQAGRLQESLEQTTAELVDSQRVTTSLQEELANARRGEKEAGERLEEASFRCAKAEKSLAQVRGERASFESALRDVERARDAQAKELPDRARESRHVASQTSVAYREYCDIEQTLLRSQGDLEQARADLASSKKKTAELEQQLVGSAAEKNEAIQEARRNSELASARKEEIINVSKREQAALGELRQARTSLKDAEEGRERALVATERAKHHFTEVESSWRRETKDLRAALNESAGASGKDAEYSQHATVTSGVQPSSLQQPPVVVAGDPATQNEAPQASASGASDATSRDLAEELLRKLTDETKRRRSTRQALSDQASRSWTTKLEEEKRMLALAKEAVKHHRERVKQRQQRLLLCQARWRHQRRVSESPPPHKRRSRHSARQRSLEDTKRDLDSEVHKLNRFVKKLRSSKHWLDQRERKILDFEALLEADGSGLESRPDQNASTGSSSGAHMSTESSVQLRSLEAMQQELDNDLSDFTFSSSAGHLGHSRPVRGNRKPTRGYRHPSNRGKENTLPGSRPMYSMDLPHSASPAPQDFWGHPPRYFQERPRSQGRVPPGSRASHRQHSAGRRDGTVADRDFSESDLRRWLNRAELDDFDEIRSGKASRERREHLAKVTLEGRQAESTVALHVDWLNTLREEMGLLGFHCRKASEPTKGISAAVDALVSPRQALDASTGGLHSAHEV